MSRPTVHTAKPADAYAAPNEKIVEFFDKDAQRGGLISIIRRDDGTLNVGVYNMDDGVSVSCSVISGLLKALKVIEQSLGEAVRVDTKHEYLRALAIQAQAHAAITISKAEGKS